MDEPWRTCYMDAIIVAVVRKLLPYELSVLVSDDGVWHAKPMQDVKEKIHSLC